MGTGPFFGGKSCLAQKTSAENMDLSPFAAQGGHAMATNLAIDDELLRQAVRLGKQRTKKATVNEALREYVQRRQRLKALGLFGDVDFDLSYNYKAERKKR